MADEFPKTAEEARAMMRDARERHDSIAADLRTLGALIWRANAALPSLDANASSQSEIRAMHAQMAPMVSALFASIEQYRSHAGVACALLDAQRIEESELCAFERDARALLAGMDAFVRIRA